MTYASWLTRVGTNTVDGLTIAPFLVAGMIIDGPDEMTVTGALLTLAAFVVFGYNRWYLAGRTGQGWGHRVFGVHLVGDRTGKPIGMGRAALRDLAHLADAATLYLGYLLPLVTGKRQTIGDMLSRTVVVTEATAPEPALSHG